MGVYIPGSHLPDSCASCFYQTHCTVLSRWMTPSKVAQYSEERHKNCPMVEFEEPHGRLIDEDTIERC